MKTDYPIVIGGQNFGCGSSREHAPVAMGASGTTVVVAESYGGRDEPVDSLVRALVSVGVEPLLEPLRVKADPTEALYQVGVGLV